MNFIDIEILYNLIDHLIDDYKSILKSKESNFLKNSLDPFSALIQVHHLDNSIGDWKKMELDRQTSKSLQNKIGAFHQSLLGSFHTFKELEKGNTGDIISFEKNIVAELKNKFNTVKGSDKKEIYDELSDALKKHPGFTAYYVEIISKDQKRYNHEFTPSDNRKGGNRPSNSKIRIVDGSTFYDIASGEQGTLEKIYIEIVNYMQSKHSLSEESGKELVKIFKTTF